MTEISLEQMKIFKSVRPDGYQMGNVEVVSGEVNNLFGNFSEVDFAAGAFDIRKAFLYGASTGQEIFAKAWVAVTVPPENENVTLAMFSTRDWFDNVAAHKGYLENYLDDGARTQWLPLETQNVEGLTLQMWARMGTKALQPIEVGGTYVLAEGDGVSYKSQAVQVVEVSYSTFTQFDGTREYTVETAEVRISASLRYTFTGSSIGPYFPSNPATLFKKTVNTGATRLYGIMRLAYDLDGGSSSLTVDSIYGQVIPASTSVTLAVDQTAAGRTVNLVQSAGGFIELSYALNIGPGLPVYLGSPCEPNSVSITADSVLLTETGGVLFSGSTRVATINAEIGLILPLEGSPLYTGTKTIRFRPAGLIEQPQQSTSILITTANQARAYSVNLGQRPAKGSVVVAYLAGGTWYELIDNGAAIVGSNTAFGSATVSSLNTLSMSFGTAPDVGSRVVIFWGVDSYTLDRSAASVPKAYFDITLANAFGHGALSLAWNDGIDDRTATDVDGALTGDATGQVFYGQKKIKFRPNITPPAGTVLTVTITPRLSATETFEASAVVSGGTASITLANDDVKAKTVRVQYVGLVTPGQAPAYTPSQPVQADGEDGYSGFEQDAMNPNFYNPLFVITNPEAHTAEPSFADNGTGGWVGLSGSINLAAGTLSIPSSLTISVPKFSWILAAPGSNSPWYVPAGWINESQSVQFGSTGKIVVSYTYGDDLTELDETFTLSALKIELVPGTVEAVISGSYRGTFGSKTLIEQGGAIYADVENDTGTGVWVGSMNPAARIVTLTTWEAGGSNAPSVQSLRTRLGQPATTQCVIKVPSAPIKSGGFSVRAIQLDGTAISATVNVSNLLQDDGIDGTVNLEQAVALVRFGEWVTAAGNEGQPWYHSADVVSGQIFKPLPVYSDSILYNATLETRTALPSDVIETDTARYPKDGRLELARSRDLIYIHHTDSFTISSPTSGQSVDCERTYLERVWIKDANGDDVPTALYTATSSELDAGVFHLVSVGFTLTGHPAPWTVYHRISDLRTAGYVGRFGAITLRDRPTHASHFYPADETLVSTVLYAGNLQADWTPPIARTLWPGNFNDPTGGTPATTAYDWGNFPPLVANNGVTARLRVAFVFQDSTHFKCIIDGLGQIDSGVAITADYAPINPATGQPWFTIQGNVGDDEPWGTGWAANNYLYMEFSPSTFPFEVIRCLMPSDPPPSPADSGTLEFHCATA